MQLNICKAQPEDVEPARQLVNRSWLVTYTPLIGADKTREIIAERHSVARFAAQAANNRHMFLIAKHGSDVVGHSYAYPQDGLYIDRLHVDPDLKGSGIGRAIITFIEQECVLRTKLWFEVLRGNDRAIGFYNRMGFSMSHEIPDCGGLAGIPAFVFKKYTGLADFSRDVSV